MTHDPHVLLYSIIPYLPYHVHVHVAFGHTVLSLQAYRRLRRFPVIHAHYVLTVFDFFFSVHYLRRLPYNFWLVVIFDTDSFGKLLFTNIKKNKDD